MGASEDLMEDTLPELKGASSDGKDLAIKCQRQCGKAPTCWENFNLQSEREVYKRPDAHVHTHTPQSRHIDMGKNLTFSYWGPHQQYWMLRDHRRIFFLAFPRTKNFKEETKRVKSLKRSEGKHIWS